jgi:hypothetical protein
MRIANNNYNNHADADADADSIHTLWIRMQMAIIH